MDNKEQQQKESNVKALVGQTISIVYRDNKRAPKIVYIDSCTISSGNFIYYKAYNISNNNHIKHFYINYSVAESLINHKRYVASEDIYVESVEIL